MDGPIQRGNHFKSALVLQETCLEIERLGSHDLDLDAIDRAISPDTRAILINSPNNPTGKIYPEETLRRLGQLLTKRSSGASDGCSISE